MKKINEEASKHIISKEQYNAKIKELDAANGTIKQLKKDAEGRIRICRKRLRITRLQ